VDWYRRIRPEPPLDDAQLRQLDDSAVWERVRADPTDVMLWHGPHPVERIFVLRACWHLRDQAQRVHEAAMPPSDRQWKSRARPRFFDAVTIAGPEAMLLAWGRRAKVHDVAARARRWEELRDPPGDWIRVLVGDDMVSFPVTHHDAKVVKACAGGGWSDSLRLVATILTDHPIGLNVMVWRVRELIRTGTLECRGADNRIGLPAEVRLAGGAGAAESGP
jgi:hypothetical protein